MASDRSSPRAQCHLQPLRQSRRTAARRSGLPHRTPGPGDLRRNPRHRLTSASTWYRPPTDGVWQLAGISQQGERLKPPDDGGLAVVQGGQTACRRRWVGLDDGAAGGGRRERRPVILVGWRPDCYPSQRGVEVVTDRRIVCGRGRRSRRAFHLSRGANCRETPGQLCRETRYFHGIQGVCSSGETIGRFSFRQARRFVNGLTENYSRRRAGMGRV